jgi:hypothetical protein
MSKRYYVNESWSRQHVMSKTTAYSVMAQAVDDSSWMFFQQLLLAAAGLQGITSV